MQVVREKIRSLLRESVNRIASENNVDPAAIPEILIERPKFDDQGDMSTNIAMQVAGIFKDNPRRIAEKIISNIHKDEHIERMEVAGPGFINFFLTSLWMKDTIGRILKEKENFGKQDIGKGRKVQVEFVSANPTGPLHIGHGRGAAVGDIISNILSVTGWDVSREYYVNDAGLQMDILGKSTQARYFELCGRKDRAPFPEDGYKGNYIYDIAKEIINSEGERFLDIQPEDSLEKFTDYAAGRILEGIKKDLERFGVNFDRWFSEKSLYERSLVPSTVSYLEKHHYAYRSEGAVWFRATMFDDEKDRVLIRGNGVPTYFASDVAYHKEKYDRGFERVIDVWGADHHGYIPRLKAAISSLERNPEAFDVLLIQFVNLLREGEQIAMSTRAGEFVTLSDVVDEVGVDATRYYFVMRRSDSHLDFDLELAKKASTDNPVFYVQYAHARICSILSEAAERNVTVPSVEDLDPKILGSAEEKKLVTTLSAFSDELRKASEELAPHMLVNYVHQLAGDFHSFYNAHRILGENRDVEGARLLIARVVKQVIAENLKILGISAPERM